MEEGREMCQREWNRERDRGKRKDYEERMRHEIGRELVRKAERK